MGQVKAVIFDYIGTIVNCIGYSMDASKMKLYTSLVEEGFRVTVDDFLEAYSRAHEKYRVIRYGEWREVTNAVWVAEALNEVGYKVDPDDAHIKVALNVFFKDFIDSLRLRVGAVKLFEQAISHGKVGLLSNFTYAPVVYFSLNKLGVSKYFDTVVVSEENGWRKPSPHIFRDVLERLQVSADEAVYIGDSPHEDIKGAKDAGLRTVFVRSQFYSLKDLTTCSLTAEFTAKNLNEVSEIFSQITK
ncbi:MAG: HAD family hydrolase [Candidatus Bathyarchaeota archaeon]|nr:HAD family hydrolase [Candidatus Termiticorpusculum sp.]